MRADILSSHGGILEGRLLRNTIIKNNAVGIRLMMNESVKVVRKATSHLELKKEMENMAYTLHCYTI